MPVPSWWKSGIRNSCSSSGLIWIGPCSHLPVAVDLALDRDLGDVLLLHVGHGDGELHGVDVVVEVGRVEQAADRALPGEGLVAGRRDDRAAGVAAAVAEIAELAEVELDGAGVAVSAGVAVAVARIAVSAGVAVSGLTVAGVAVAGSPSPSRVRGPLVSRPRLSEVWVIDSPVESPHASIGRISRDVQRMFMAAVYTL